MHKTTAILAATLVATLIAMPGFAVAQDNEYAEPLTELANGKITEIATNPLILEALAEQNTLNAEYDQAKIDEMDTAWRAEVDAADKPFIDAVLATEASKYLAAQMEESGGMFTEIFVTDRLGLNVAQGSVTSDFWQGDEEKHTESFGKGAGAVYLGEIEEDESTQTFQSQVSVTIADPASGEPIGAITVGVDLSML
jgi:hypothetical protein